MKNNKNRNNNLKYGENTTDFPKSVCLSVLTGTYDKKLNGHQIC